MDSNVFLDIFGTFMFSQNLEPLTHCLLQQYFKKIQEHTQSIFKTYYFHISQSCGFPKKWRPWKRQAPNNDEDPCKILEKLGYEINNIIYQKTWMEFW